MKLYFSKGACSLAIRININELGLEAEYESVDLKAKKTASGQDYLKINPKGSVPALEIENGQVLTENIAIQLFLGNLAKNDRILPTISNFNRDRVVEWLSCVATDLHKSCSPLFNPQVPEDFKQSIFIPILKKKLHYFNESLSGKTYLMGDTYTLPDAYLYVVLRWMNNFKVDVSDWNNLHTFMQTMESRDAVKKSLQQEGY